MQDKKIGTLFGIFIPNVTMMFGVIIFLRLGVIVSHAGLFKSLLVIGFSLLIMLITSASTATIATNMKVGSGGVYYLITRSLGLEVGGALGFVILLSQILSIAMTMSAFAYTIVEIFPYLDVTLVEVGSLLLLTLISSVSANLALRTQGIILIVLLIAIGSIFFGSMDGVTIPENPKPFFESGDLSFWLAFAMLYPALTGIEAGMALTGNLKNPARSLLVGNITSLIFVAATYAAVLIYGYIMIPYELLKSDPFAFMYYASQSWMVMVGICAATLSSALGSLLGAPRILQSMSQDGLVFPILGREYGPYREPRWALALTAVLSCIIMVSTNIDQIIPIYAMICLISYTLLNLTSGVSEMINAPSWRPSFHCPHLLSLFGAALTIIAMFMIDPGWSFTAIFLITGFYFIIYQKSFHVSFEDIRNSMYFFLTRYALYRFEGKHLKASTWHPQLLVLSVAPTQNPNLVLLSNSLAKVNGLLTFASVVPQSWDCPAKLPTTLEALRSFFLEKKIQCIVDVHAAETPSEGFINLIKSHGIGALQPNTIVVPIDEESDVDDGFIELVKACYAARKNLIIFKASGEISEANYEAPKKRNSKLIDIWWDSSERQSSNLLVSYVTSLRESKKWARSIVRLNAISGDEGEEPVEEFLEKFVQLSRLNMEVAVHRQSQTGEVYEFIPQYTQNEILTFQTLKPFQDPFDEKEYQDYIKHVIRKTKSLKSDCVFVSNYDEMDHSEIYNFPTKRNEVSE